MIRRVLLAAACLVGAFAQDELFNFESPSVSVYPPFQRSTLKDLSLPLESLPVDGESAATLSLLSEGLLREKKGR